MSSSSTTKPLLNPSTFPRPPKLEPTSRYLEIKTPDNKHTIASTSGAYWVLETYHPPTYYLPRSSIRPEFTAALSKSARSSFCEWKGAATYWDLKVLPSSSDGTASAGAMEGGREEDVVVKDRIWSYEQPTKGFEDIRGFLSFYAGPWKCFVDGEEVLAQPGDFYGGWTTKDIDTKFVKGAAGTRHW